MFPLRLLAVLTLLFAANSAPAAFTVLQNLTGSVSVTGSFPNSAAISGTGNVSSTNYLSWSQLGADSVNFGNNALGPFTTSTGSIISAVYLVSNSFNATTGTVTAMANTPTENIQRRTSPNTYSGDFSSGEPLLFANAASSGLIIDFTVPVQGAGFRVQQDAQNSTRNDFFIQAYTGNSSGYTAIVGGGATGLQVTTNNPGVDSAPFFGVVGGSNVETFNRLFIGFANAGDAFSISTLEVNAPNITPVDPSVAPMPPSVLVGVLGAVSLAGGRWVRRRKA